MSVFAIVNPRSAGGRTAKALPAIEAALRETFGDIRIGLTTARGDGAQLATAALDAGHRHIVAIGGDGTLNEVVNGLFRDGALIAPDTVFSFAMSGSGGDTARTYGPPRGVLDAIRALKNAQTRAIDLGRVIADSADSVPTTRYFLNIASFGLSGDVVERVNGARLAKRVGGAFAFQWHSLRAMLGFKPSLIRLDCDGAVMPSLAVATVAICNGRAFGGGMRIAPDADPTDGLFDVVTITETSRLALVARLGEVYGGTHIGKAGVIAMQARHVVAEPFAANASPIFVECDGEGGLMLPATFDILPAALTLAI